MRHALYSDGIIAPTDGSSQRMARRTVEVYFRGSDSGIFGAFEETVICVMTVILFLGGATQSKNSNQRISVCFLRVRS